MDAAEFIFLPNCKCITDEFEVMCIMLTDAPILYVSF